MQQTMPLVLLPGCPEVAALFSAQTELRVPAAVEARRSTCGINQPLRWQAEAAVDYLVYTRTPRAGHGRAGTGRGHRARAGCAHYDTLESYAAGARVSVQSIYLNMRCFALLQDAAKSLKHKSCFKLLQKKSFFLLSLKSSSPVKTLLEWLTLADKNPRWRPNIEGRAYLARESTSLPEHLRTARSVIECELLARCPDAKFAQQLFGNFLEEIDDSLQLLAHADLQGKILAAIDAGYGTELEISTAVRLPRAEVRVLLESLERDRVLYRGEEVRKNLNQYKDYRWHKVGAALGSALELKQPFSAYVNKHEHW
jgi:hypothetical protein